jgi:hypothetical protein
MTQDWTWDDMLAEFRALGGIADNIRLGHGPLGRGIFAVDENEPIHIHVPDNLLFDSDGVELREGLLCLKKKKSSLSREEDFFEKFQNIFSWGGGGREDTQALIKLFGGIPPEISKLLLKGFGRNTVSDTDTPDAVLRRFLVSRRLRMANGRQVLMPILELVNHDLNGQPFTFKNGISLKAKVQSEVYARYNITDPFGSFFTWGFSGTASHAFSLSMRLTFGSQKILIKRDLAEKDKRGNVGLPVVRKNGDTITLSHLMIGNARNPRIVKGTFYHLLRPLNVSNLEEVFDRVHAINNKRFIKLLLALEDFEGPSISALRKMALLQLDAISNCFGVRSASRA